ncbi:MAG TPA: GAF domain-containing protein [Steroidobacteraceae bacterium]|nr:GAF domain-containing protein [Steroidobacteraceae bacterium]
MPAAPLPADETARLRELHSYEVLDTLPDPSFDGLTRLATQIAGVPIGLISLTDQNRQWFKSRIGLDVIEIPREWAPCAHVVATGDSIVCPDMSQDARFADNPLVSGVTHFRFYAGLALVTPRGSVLGTLAVIDTQPQTLTPAQIDALATLAKQIVSELELRAAYRDLTALRVREREFDMRLLKERTDEAQRLAAELHDGVGQELVGISIMLAAAVNEARKASSGLVAPLEEISLLLSRAIDLARRAAQEHGGFAVRAAGLSGAIEQFVRRTSRPDGPRVELSAAPIPADCLDDGTAYHLLRIAQEAIVNARRHSQGSVIKVVCGHGPGLIRISVTDDGIGLPPDDRLQPGIGQHVMAYRAQAIGAQFSVANRPGGGVAVTCELKCRAVGPCGDRAAAG